MMVTFSLEALDFLKKIFTIKPTVQVKRSKCRYILLIKEDWMVVAILDYINFLLKSP